MIRLRHGYWRPRTAGRRVRREVFLHAFKLAIQTTLTSCQSLHQRLSVDDGDPKRRHSDAFGGSLPPPEKDETAVTEPVTEKEALEATGSTAGDEKGAINTADGEEPTEHESRTLRHVAEKFPIAIFLVAFVELCERFTYYGISGLFQNYTQRPLDGSEGRGALGMGHQGATGLTTFFQFWCYVTPILGVSYCCSYR